MNTIFFSTIHWNIFNVFNIEYIFLFVFFLVRFGCAFFDCYLLFISCFVLFFFFVFTFDHSYVCCISPLSPFVIVVAVRCSVHIIGDYECRCWYFQLLPMYFANGREKKCSFNHTIIWVICDNKPSQFDTTICGITSFIEEHRTVFSKEMCTFYRENERSKPNQNTKMNLHVMISNNWQSWETFNGNFSLNLSN